MEKGSRADIQTRLAVMRQVARNKVILANGSPQFWQEVETMLERIAVAKLADMAPISENLLGVAMMLAEEVRRLRIAGG